MRIHVVLKYVGVVLLINAALMLACLILSITEGPDSGFYPLVISTSIALITGLFPFIFVRENSDLTKKESYSIVISVITASSVVGCIPFLLWGEEFSFINAIFESVSGFTTTGSTILNDIEALPKSLLLWRSSTHLLGGAGVIIFAIALLPMISKSRVSLSNVELSPFVKDNYKYKVQKGVQIILYVYFLLIVAETFLLRVAGMSWFDAVNHAFSTVSTGGFSTKNTSILAYNNIWIETIIIGFMAISGVHLGLLYSTITTKRTNIFRSEVTRLYFFTLAVAIVIVAVNLWTTYSYSLVESFRFSAFQVVSIMTTTGFATADISLWPPLAIIAIVYISFNGGCAGSTAGGIQTDRMLLMYKSLRAQFRQMQHPNAVQKMRFSRINTDDNLITSTLVYILLFIFLVLMGTLISAAMGLDIVTGFSASLSSLSNIGPGFGIVGSYNNYAGLPEGAKVLYTFMMIAGRLQLFGFLQFFLLRKWR